MRACLTLYRSKSEIIQVPTRHIPFMLSLFVVLSRQVSVLPRYARLTARRTGS